MSEPSSYVCTAALTGILLNEYFADADSHVLWVVEWLERQILYACHCPAHVVGRHGTYTCMGDVCSYDHIACMAMTIMSCTFMGPYSAVSSSEWPLICARISRTHCIPARLDTHIVSVQLQADPTQCGSTNSPQPMSGSRLYKKIIFSWV